MAAEEEVRRSVEELAQAIYEARDPSGIPWVKRGPAVRDPWTLKTSATGEENVMPEANKIAAAILACEASRQQQKMAEAGPGRLPTERDITGELWFYFNDFLGRLEGESAGDQVTCRKR